MAAIKIDGKRVALEVRQELKSEVSGLREQGIVPKLAVVLVGEDPASQIYVRSKTKAAIEAGIEVVDHHLGKDASQQAVMDLVSSLNADKSVSGILVQLPLPEGLDAHAVTTSIDPEKDVDGFHPENLGLLLAGAPRFVAATPWGCMELLRRYDIAVAGKRAVVIGRSVIVGRPMAALLINANATVTVCHSKTQDIAKEVQRADIVVAAVGRAKFVKAEWLKPGATVIDVGINRDPESGKLSGDVDYAAALDVCAFVTPVPGGVGPMTIASLLANTVKAAKRQAGWPERS